ncbi:MAG: DUF1592 domain-containing protein [Candidatus Hydrogenedens sp.]|nr:DUF1592 domain-containing protein [Candidatus Hydrogenedens sp.]
MRIRLIHKLAFGCAVACIAPCVQAEDMPQPPPPLAYADYAQDVVPFVQQHCVSCHNPDKLKGDLDLQRFETMDQVVDAIAVWQRAAIRVKNGEMPPRRTDAPPDDQRNAFVTWAEGLQVNTVDCDVIATEETVGWFPGVVMSRRLNRAEYQNTMRDLLGVPVDVEHLFPADNSGGEGFDTTGDTLYLSAIQMEKYLEAADRAIETALPRFDALLANVKERPGTRLDYANARRLLITAEPSEDLPPSMAATLAISSFIERAWRRAPEPTEVGRLVKIFNQAFDRGDTYLESLKLAYKAALISPNFLFLVEPKPAERGEYALGGYELASRLSYFLWSSMPDEELFGLARTGRLQSAEALQQQVARMLRDPRARGLGEQFASQWLEITPLGETKLPDPTRYPEFDASLAQAMRDEVVTFFYETIRTNASLLQLIDSKHTFVNERLAKLYGFEGITGDDFQRVWFADDRRGGVMGMAAVLTVTSHPLRTSPVNRGKWVMEQLLGERVPPPPPNVPALPADTTHDETLSLREQMEVHRENPDCAGCHSRMDPIGFGLESYDPLGRWRTQPDGSPIDTAAQLPSGEAFNGPAELKKVLLANRDGIMRNLARKTLGYALGRALTQYDECVIDDCIHNLQASNYRPTELFSTIVLSYPFRHRFSGGESDVKETS